MIAVVAVVAISCHALGGWLLDRWFEDHGAFGHGPLVLALGLPWLCLAARRAPRSPQAWPAVLLALPALILLWIHVARGSGSAGALAAWLLLITLVTAGGGTAFLRALFPILGLLFFAVPWPLKFVDDVSLPLKEVAVQIGMLCAPAGVTREATSATLLVNGGELLVGDVCSGLRSSVSLLAVAWMLAALLRLPTKRFVMVVMLAPIAAVLANGLRVAGLVHVAARSGVNACAPGTWVHDGSGIVAFVAAAALIFLACRGARSQPPVQRLSLSPPRRVWFVSIAGLALSVAFCFSSAAADPAPIELRVDFPAQLQAGGGAQIPGRTVELEASTRELLRPTGWLYRAWGAGDRYSACLVYGVGPDVRLHAPEICYRGAGWEILGTTDLPLPDAMKHGPERVHEIFLQRPEGKRLSWVIYRSGEFSTHSYNSFVWGALWKPQAPQALVFVSAPADSGLNHARDELRWLLRQITPTLEGAFERL